MTGKVNLMSCYPTSCVEALTPATYSPKVNKNTIFSWFLVVCGRLVHGHPNLFSYLGLTVHPTFSLHVYRFLWWQDSTFKILARETRGRIRSTPSLSSLPRLFHPPFSPSALRESGEEARRRVNGQGNKELSYFMSVLREWVSHIIKEMNWKLS